MWIFTLCLACANLKYNSYRIERAAILNFIPHLKLHDIVVLSNLGESDFVQSQILASDFVQSQILASDFVQSQILAIDFTPLNQSNPNTIFKLFIGQSVPAKIRIRPMKTWILKQWYSAPEIEINGDFKYLFENINKTKWEKMNLYKNNCKHFAHHFIKQINS